MYKIGVKSSQLEPNITGKLYQNTYYVDDSEVNGLSVGTFCSVQSGTSQCYTENGKIQATLKYAGKDVKRKASGIIYETSAKDRYGRSDDFEDEYNLFPYGYREDTAIALVKTGVITVSNTEKYKTLRVYQPFDVMVETVSIDTEKDTFKIKKSKTKLEYGDKIQFICDAGRKKSIHYVVDVKDELDGQLVSFVPKTTETETSVILKCMIGEPVYLNNVPKVHKGLYESKKELPFTTVPAQSGELDQIVGYIESPMHIRIDLTKSINPKIKE